MSLLRGEEGTGVNARAADRGRESTQRRNGTKEDKKVANRWVARMALYPTVYCMDHEKLLDREWVGGLTLP